MTPRIDGPSDLDALALRYFRARRVRVSVAPLTFELFLHAPDFYERRGNERLRQWENGRYVLHHRPVHIN